MELDKKQFSNRYFVAIEAQTTAFTSPAYELMAEGEYTLSCTALNVDEKISMEIYDQATESWQSFMIDGDAVEFIKNYENLTIEKMACIVRFVKTTTSQEVGLTIAYKGISYFSVKQIGVVS